MSKLKTVLSVVLGLLLLFSFAQPTMAANKITLVSGQAFTEDTTSYNDLMFTDTSAKAWNKYTYYVTMSYAGNSYNLGVITSYNTSNGGITKVNLTMPKIKKWGSNPTAVVTVLNQGTSVKGSGYIFIRPSSPVITIVSDKLMLDGKKTKFLGSFDNKSSTKDGSFSYVDSVSVTDSATKTSNSSATLGIPEIQASIGISLSTGTTYEVGTLKNCTATIAAGKVAKFYLTPYVRQIKVKGLVPNYKTGFDTVTYTVMKYTGVNQFKVAYK